MTIWQNRMFCECLLGKPYSRASCETQLSPSCPDFSHSRHVRGTCITSWDAQSRATCENTSIFNLPRVFTLSLSHTTLTIKSHIKYRVQKIEQNYNQICHRIRANKTHSCKLQVYNLLLWLFHDKTPKTNSRLKREFGNSGKTHSHLIQEL